LESIVYAVDWSQARENVFAGAAWMDGAGAGGGGAEVIEALRKPTALVCSSRGADKTTQSLGRAKRDEHLVALIKSCVTRGGTVLIPVDSSARVLEMSYMLEHAWRTDASAENGGDLKSAKLYLAGRNMSSTMRYARSMLEWMDNSIVQEFEAFAEGQRRLNGGSDKKEGGPFDFKYLRLLERKAQIAKLLSRDSENVQTEGRVILASDTSMEWGFSKDLLKGLVKDSRNLVILTDRPGARREGKSQSITRTLWTWWEERKEGVAVEQTESGDKLDLVYAGGQSIEIQEAHRKALEGDELALYQQWLAQQRQLHATQQAGGAGGVEASGDIVDDALSDSSSESESEDGEQQGKALNISTTLGQAGRKNIVLKDEDLGVNVLIKKKGVYDYDTRGKKGRDKMFPISIRRKRVDDYGEVIRPEDFLRAEEKQEEGMDSADMASNEDLGKKRKWGDMAKTVNGSNKRPQTNRALSAADEGDGAAADDGYVPDELDGVEDTEHVEPTGPSKLLYTTESLKANLRIAYVDFSGLHDKRSLNMLIPLIQPRKLILVGGNTEETMALAKDCRIALSGNGEREVDVFTPSIGESVDASVDTNAWTVKIADALYKGLKWQNLNGLAIATINGLLFAPVTSVDTSDIKAENDDDGEPNKRQKTGDEAQKQLVATSTAVALSNPLVTSSIPTLDIVPDSRASTIRSMAPPIHVGELRLADLRKAMLSANYSADFIGEGTLLIDGGVAVKKTAAGKIEVESTALPIGGRNSSFYKVRQFIYDNLAVVSGV
jgi:cleavage and polyadenylation specificity factor subunit 2